MFKFGRPGLNLEMPSLMINFDNDDDEDDENGDTAHAVPRLTAGEDSVDRAVFSEKDATTPEVGRGYTPLLVAAEANHLVILVVSCLLFIPSHMYQHCNHRV